MDWIGLYAHKSLITADSSASATDIAQLMAKNHIDSVIIKDDDKVTGLVTDRAICRKIVGEGGDAKSAIKDIVSNDIPRMHLESTIEEAVDEMRKSEHRYLFILDKDGESVIGVVSMQDLVRALKERLEEEATALKQYISGEM